MTSRTSTDRCYEYAGRATGAGNRRRCERPATWHAFFLGEWRTLCSVHFRSYSDLPAHRLNTPYHGPHEEEEAF
jgi:hypothetical protein